MGQMNFETGKGQMQFVTFFQMLQKKTINEVNRKVDIAYLPIHLSFHCCWPFH